MTRYVEIPTETKGRGGRKREFGPRVAIAFTADNVARIDAAAMRAGLTRSQWIRMTVLATLPPAE